MNFGDRSLWKFGAHGLLAALLVSPAAGQDFALKRLEESPRHHEWVKVTHDGRDVWSFVAFPETEGKAPAVVVIHENRGLTDWVRGFADQLAEAGYLAVAPDLLSGAGPDGGKTSDFPDSDAARQAIYQLDGQQVTADLNAVVDFAAKLPASSGKTVAVGFCWGGSQSFRLATNNDQIKAAFVFYGGPPEKPEDLARIQAPVYGFYAGGDARINSTIAVTQTAMADYEKTYEYEIYAGAGHAFMRRGEDPNETAANKDARSQSWKRLLRLLGELNLED